MKETSENDESDIVLNKESMVKDEDDDDNSPCVTAGVDEEAHHPDEEAPPPSVNNPHVPAVETNVPLASSSNNFKKQVPPQPLHARNNLSVLEVAKAMEAEVAKTTNTQKQQDSSVSERRNKSNTYIKRLNHRHERKRHNGTSGEEETPAGAIMIQGRRTFDNDMENVLEPENITPDEGGPPLIVAAEVFNHDEEENFGGGEDNLETKIQEEVQSRLLRDQKNAIVAEQIDPDGMQELTGKVFGLRQKTWCYLLAACALLIVGVVAGVMARETNGTGYSLLLRGHTMMRTHVRALLTRFS